MSEGGREDRERREADRRGSVEREREREQEIDREIVCVCVCGREREREGESERDRDTKRERGAALDVPEDGREDRERRDADLRGSAFAMACPGPWISAGACTSKQKHNTPEV